jgi:peroxiredoxin
VGGDPVEVAPRDDVQLTVVCFLGTECPLAKLYGPRLAKLAKEFSQVRFIGINSNVQDSTDDIAVYAANHEIGFQLLKDHRNEIADRFQAVRTPEVFVLDQEFQLQYRGRIDDQYTPGVARKNPTRADLQIAIEELLAGKVVSQPTTEATGCFIGRVKRPVESSDVTYCDQIARVLAKHCVECHRQDEIGPFRLDEYEEIVGWADTILEVIDDGRMPPWHANPLHGDFANARHMPEADKELLRNWVHAGLPYGDAKELPEPLPYTDGWQLPRTPDMVLSMSPREFVIPADGTVEYQYFVVDPKFEADKWITGAQIIPGNRAVVHHSIVFVRPPDGARFRGIGWLTAYVPGLRAGAFPDGSAIMVPAGSKLVFQQHYTPSGTEQTDITKVGLLFGDDQDIKDEVYTLVGIDQEFEIPPHAKSHKVSSSVASFPEHGQLLAIMPHMHVRGRSFRLFTKRDNQTEILLDVPNYDFNWQHSYRLVEPLPLSSIDELKFDITFDNSSSNLANPDPAQHVTWGDQTWEEMAVAFFEVLEPREKPESAKADQPHSVDTLTLGIQTRMKAEADRMLNAFDKNKDGEIIPNETPIAFRRHGFWEIDRDGNGRLSRDEIEQAARRRVR